MVTKEESDESLYGIAESLESIEANLCDIAVSLRVLSKRPSLANEPI